MVQKRAAVVIGVNRTGGLTPLKSAAAGAKKVAAWLRKEGYDVSCITDEKKPVQPEQVEKAIRKFVTNPPRYHFLLVYFSGHGYWSAKTDRWLLSEAPVSSTAAVNLRGAEDLAKYSGIPNVVFVSDACRSIPLTREGQLVTGIDAFPNYADISRPSKIDWFKATSEATAAYENDFDGTPESLLTRALMSAFKEPDEKMVRQVTDGQGVFDVVPNRHLEDYLQNEVDELLSEIDLNLSQILETNVPSGDDVYIARVRAPRRRVTRGITPPARSGPRPAPSSVGRSLSNAIGSLVSSGHTEPAEVAAEAAAAAFLPFAPVDHFESKVGFTVRGATIKKVVATKGMANAWLEVLDYGDGADRPGVVRLWEVEPAVSVAIQVEDGRCAIVPALRGYVGHVTFAEQGVANVSYVPSTNTGRWRDFFENRPDEVDRLNRLRALVAAAIDQNTFSVAPGDGGKLASQIRIEKAQDPTLGIYAAHAYSQAGEDWQVADVLNWMEGDLQTQIFDVRALASRQRGWDAGRVVPFCPVLTQTWSLLRARGIVLPEVLQEAAPDLCNSLWSTFTAEAGNRIIEAMEKGVLQ